MEWNVNLKWEEKLGLYFEERAKVYEVQQFMVNIFAKYLAKIANNRNNFGTLVTESFNKD